MFGFYGYQRLIAGRSESEIWSKLYFQENWQLFFDIFNSIPLMLFLLGVSYFFGFRWGVLLSASALLHIGCDLPLHHDDAHRHLLPFSDWRFVSPVSYWDPKHYGAVFIWLELTFALGSCIYVGWGGKQQPIRYLAMATLLFYFAVIVFAIWMWLPQLLGRQ